MPIAAALSSLATALRPRKGDQTRAAIVDAALAIASREGLEGLTIGTLADQMQMSKSGVFAHFGSREDLQLAVLKEYVQRFVAEVLKPAVKKPRGLPRLEAILDRWVAFLAREITRGCIMIAGAVEYDDRPGPQRDRMVAIIAGWKAELLKAIRQAVAEGHLRPDVDANQMVFEAYGLMLAMHQDARLLRSADSARRARTGLARLIAAASVSTPNRKSHAQRAGSTRRGAQIKPPGTRARRAAPRKRRVKST
jgi:AcrR family transcriptional regulator